MSVVFKTHKCQVLKFESLLPYSGSQLDKWGCNLLALWGSKSLIPRLEQDLDIQAYEMWDGIALLDMLTHASMRGERQGRALIEFNLFWTTN